MVISYIFLLLLFVVGLFATYFIKFTSKNQANDVQNIKFDEQKTVVVNKSVVAPTTNGTSNKNNLQFKAELKSVFATFDKNSDGYITSDELKESLKNIGITMSDKDVKEMVEKVDANGDNLIDIDEFCTLFESIMSTSNVENEVDGAGEQVGGYLKEAFNVFDEDGDGVITVEELGLVLSSLGFKEGKLMESCKEMIRKVDVDGDGKINFDEFKMMMKAGSKFLPVS